MTDSETSIPHHRLKSSLAEPLAISAVIIVLVISGVIAVRNFSELRETRLMVRHTNRVLASLQVIESSLSDAESSQLGYVVTGEQAYLGPFSNAVGRSLEQLGEFDEITKDNPIQQRRIPILNELMEKRVAELRRAVSQRNELGPEAAREAIIADVRHQTHDRIRDELASMRETENMLLVLREQVAARAYHTGIVTSIVSTLTGLVLVGGVLYLLNRNRRKAEQAAIEMATIRERLQRALDAGEMGSWNIDLKNNELRTDKTFRRIFGSDQSAVTYERAFELVHPEDRQHVMDAIARATRPIEPEPYACDYRIVLPDGKIRWVLAQGATHVDGARGDKIPTTFDGTIVDITERKLVESRLIESQQLALAANRSKSEFLANMSHEIRTPMAAILGYCDVLLGHLKDPDNRGCVNIMKRNGEHLLELINDILDLSRIEAGKLDVDIQSCSLPQLVGDLQSLMRVRAEAKSLDFIVEFEGPVPDTIHTDATRLRQILINLIGNAIKFAERGRVTVAVRLLLDVDFKETIPLDDPTSPKLSNNVTGNWIEFAVSDTGIGMSDEQQSRLFKPFSQGDSSVTREYGGSGLGLAISQRLVRILRGEISMTSKFGNGSTFYVRLPAGPTDTLRLVKPDLIPEDAESVHPSPRDRRLDCRVLVVDDRRDVRHISQHFLEKAGATVRVAEDGQQAIDAVLAARESGEPFDLIVMDMQMPNVDGLQATSELRSSGVHTPIIALTADAMKGDRERCLDGGCDDYLSKPIDHAKLVELVWRYTNDFSQEDLIRRRRERTSGLKASINNPTA